MITRWDPFRDMSVLQDRINRIFSEQAGRGEIETASGRAWAPVVDILETESDLVVRAELAGLSREEIDIEVTSEYLTVRGERKFDEGNKEKFIRVERPYGPFQRTFSIGVPVQPDKVRASYRDGLLEVTIPKAEEVKPKKIKVNAE
ncbi:MAG: Hsp20/alpha crystallin family protein [Armatimonadetes bacterium]|nr:Hsp20/alpha crystallin family protein [Armatimonadota bacterium]